jgi:glycolate oxidase FAD binding subunit
VSQAGAGSVADPPRSDLTGLAAEVRAAGGRRSPIEVRGSAEWWSDAPPGVTLISTAGLDTISDFNPADLVVTAGAGTPLDRLAACLAAKGAWLPLDPPGPLSRTVGGVLACGAGGPLAAHYGPPRDHVLGLVVVAGDGTVVRLGGRVVKNVAGFDLAKLVVGGCGAFGVIAEAHLRLRARPGADRTEMWTGGRAWAERTSAAAMAAGATPAALELVSPELAVQLGWGAADGWVLAARAVGAPEGVAEELATIAKLAGSPPVFTAAGDDPWAAWRLGVGRWPVVLRIGAEPHGWADAAALAERHVGPLLGASVTAPRGTVRVGTERCSGEAVARLRSEAARRDWPVTLERADAATRAAAGVWGALSPTVARLTRGLKATFDPAGVLAAPLLA